MEHVASLNLMKRNNDISKENNVLFSERDCETRNDARQNIQKL